MNPYPRTWVDIRLPAVEANLALIRERIGPGPLIAIVAKADAYGHGLVPVARYAVQNGADWVCVATVQEGVALRDAGISQPILVISPVLPIESEQAVFYDLRITIEDLALAKELDTVARSQGKTCLVHLEIDTGLNRFGCMPEEAPALVSQLLELECLTLEGVSQHFVDSGGNPDRTHLQMDRFNQVVKLLPPVPILHVANSAGATKFNEARDLVRIGIAAYGIDPYDMLGGRAQPLLTWHSRVCAFRRAKAGETVGYSETLRLKAEAELATVGVGYGDGYPRSLSNVGFVAVRGNVRPICGLVCMDQLIVDVTALGVEVGDEVELIGPQVRVQDLARWSHTNSHEIVTRIMSRVPRRYLYDPI